MEIRQVRFFLWKIAVLLIFKQIVEEAKPRVKDYLLLFIFIFWVDEYFVFAEEIVFILSSDKIKKIGTESPTLTREWAESGDFPNKGYSHNSTSLIVKMIFILELILFTFVILQNMGLTGFDSKIDG